MPSCRLYMTPYPPLKTTTLSIYDITCPLLMSSGALYMTCHLLCMISLSLYVWLHTMPVSLTSHTLCLWHIHFIWHHTVLWQHKHCVTSQPLCLTSHPQYLRHHTQWISFIKPSVCMKSQPQCVWHHIHYMWHLIHNLGHHTTLCMTSGPLYLTSFPRYLCHHTYPIDDITAIICMTSHQVYLWHHIHYIYDIISTKYDITTLCDDDATLGTSITYFALQMTTHLLYHTKPQDLWCHIHFREDNTAPVSDIASTVSMSSHCLHWHLTHYCMTSHPPLFDIIWTIYITSHPILMS